MVREPLFGALLLPFCTFPRETWGSGCVAVVKLVRSIWKTPPKHGFFWSSRRERRQKLTAKRSGGLPVENKTAGNISGWVFSKSIKTMICIGTTCNAGDANSCSSTSTRGSRSLLSRRALQDQEGGRGEQREAVFIPILRSLSCLISGSLVYNYSYTALYTSSNAFRPVCLKRGDAK